MSSATSTQLLVWKNYRPVPVSLSVENAENCISVFDRGFQYGDGFFTTAKVQGGSLLNWSAHKLRLQMSAKRLGFPELDFVKLEQSLKKQFNAYEQKDCVCKVIVTRGVGGRGYQPPETPDIQVLSILMPLPESNQSTNPIQIQISPVILEVSPELAGVKHLNRLSNVLARQSLESGYEEAIMFNALGQLQCATQSNVFVIKHQEIFTPPVNFSGVAGTARSGLASLAKEKILTIEDILNADAVFLTNAVRGIQVVGQLDLANWDILQRKFLQFGLNELPSVSSRVSNGLVFNMNRPLIHSLIIKLQQQLLQNEQNNALNLN